ncbi:hypothetical protein F5Y11DRAFT_367249 [Daldinia sp. FL1419]|nr:hypothetical protein F5Y11DRAFT_367249 [Daldinia sp. FL1419]
MSTPYDVQTYLLDRANIHDTVTRWTFHCDQKSTEGLIKDVYAPQVVLDYTSIFGGHPFETNKEDWAKTISSAAATFDNCQHIVTGLIIELPQPSSGATRPEQCQAAIGGPIMHDGARLALELIRIPELEQKGENPWRLGKQIVDVAWEQGNKDVIVDQVSGIGN